ncbi:putative mitochondrial protein, partial [Mucuna pruriens]
MSGKPIQGANKMHGHKLEASRLINQRLTSSPLFQTPLLYGEVRSILGHVGFYRRFIKNFSKIVLPLSKLLQKDVEFKLTNPVLKPFKS